MESALNLEEDSHMKEFIIFGVGAIFGTLLTTLREGAQSWYLRPRLQILYDSPEEGRLFSCHSVVVTNEGRSVARNCQGTITFEALEIEVGASKKKVKTLSEKDLFAIDQTKTLGQLGIPLQKFNVVGEETYLLKPGSFRPIENEFLAWSRVGNPVSIDICPNTFAMLDVCRVIKGEKRIDIPSENGWRSVRAALKKRRYAIRIAVVAENARRVQKGFIVEPSKQDIKFKEVT